MESDRRRSAKEPGNVTASASAASSQESQQRKSDYSENPATTKPKPVITGDSQAQDIAKFAHRMTYEDLTPERRERLKVSVLDSLGCAICALGVPPIAACLEQAKQFGGSDARCTLIGGGKANVVYAAQYNTAHAIHRFHGQLSWRRGTLSPVGQLWISPGRV